MKNIVEFLQTGGVPLTNDLMYTLQEAWQLYEVLGDMAGNLTILSGCEIIGATATPGVVVIDGEVLPFVGGLITSTVYIHTEEIYKTFQDQVDKILIKKRSVRFGNATTTWNFADFVKLDTIKQIMIKANNAATSQQLATLQASFDALTLVVNGHVNNTLNPHNVTLEQLGLVKRGTIYIGDPQGNPNGYVYNGSDYTITLIEKTANSASGGDDRYRISWTTPLTTNDVIINGVFKSNLNWNSDNDLGFSILNVSKYGFDIAIREYASQVQNVSFDYLILKK